MSAKQEFVGLVTAIVDRFLRQNGRPVASVEAEGLAARLFALLAERGPPPPSDGESGRPGGMPEEIIAPLVARIAAGSSDCWLEEAARQLVKACFYPELKACRDSYRAEDAGGRCRRQELPRVRGRMSGSHCVDCPHWVGLDGAAHRDLLAGSWRGDGAEWGQYHSVFLPEDFRALRRWLYAYARDPASRAKGRAEGSLEL